MHKDIEPLWTLIEPYVRAAGMDLIEIHYGREAEGWVLRVFIDRPSRAEASTPEVAADFPVALGQPTVTHVDCERVSRDLSAALDVSDAIPHAYHLEVSSPGLDRPLRRECDFARFAGQKARIRTVGAIEGRRNFVGTLRTAAAGLVEIECDGRAYALPVDLVARANLVPDYSGAFRKAERSMP